MDLAIDLAGRDILDAIQTSVNPKVIDCPDPKKGKETIDAVAQDGICLLYTSPSPRDRTRSRMPSSA